jgi:hypothetical protein
VDYSPRNSISFPNLGSLRQPKEEEGKEDSIHSTCWRREIFLLKQTLSAFYNRSISIGIIIIVVRG